MAGNVRMEMQDINKYISSDLEIQTFFIIVYFIFLE